MLSVGGTSSRPRRDAAPGDAIPGMVARWTKTARKRRGYMTTRLFLLGLPGSGKTAVGRAVAEMLGWRFMDTDDLIEERTGVSIERLFAEAGEDGFRGAEAEALLDAARAGRVVIATGGGVVVRSGNRALMRDAGWR